MPVSPQEKLRALEDVLREKEKEKKQEQEKAQQTEEELKKLKAALRAEQEELLREEELAQTITPVRESEEEAPQKKEEEPFSIDELVADAPKNQQLGGALYALQERLQQGSMNLYELTQTANALTSLRQEGALTNNQYNILNQFESELREKGVQTGYSNQQQLYAQQATNTIDSIKQRMGVKIGDTYHDTSDLMQ